MYFKVPCCYFLMTLYEIDTFYESVKKYTIVFCAGVAAGYIGTSYVSCKNEQEKRDFTNTKIMEKILSDAMQDTR